MLCRNKMVFRCLRNFKEALAIFECSFQKIISQYRIIIFKSYSKRKYRRIDITDLGYNCGVFFVVVVQ